MGASETFLLQIHSTRDPPRDNSVVHDVTLLSGGEGGRPVAGYPILGMGGQYNRLYRVHRGQLDRIAGYG